MTPRQVVAAATSPGRLELPVVRVFEVEDAQRALPVPATRKPSGLESHVHIVALLRVRFQPKLPFQRLAVRVYC